jgi:hypothetical protein
MADDTDEDRQGVKAKVWKNLPYEFNSDKGTLRYIAKCDEDQKAGANEELLEPGPHTRDVTRHDGVPIRLRLTVSCDDAPAGDDDGGEKGTTPKPPETVATAREPRVPPAAPAPGRAGYDAPLTVNPIQVPPGPDRFA